MSWYGHQLLYDFGDNRLAVLDATADRWTRLDALVQAIPRRSPTETGEAAWASAFARADTGT
jgi:hypothetical protein